MQSACGGCDGYIGTFYIYIYIITGGVNMTITPQTPPIYKHVYIYIYI